MGTWVMTLTTNRQLTGQDASMKLSVFAFSRDAAEKKLMKKATLVYGENFSVGGIERK